MSRISAVGLLGDEFVGWEMLVADWGQKSVALRAELGLHATADLSKEKGFVYFIESPRAIKIGRSVDVPHRLNTLQRYNPDRLRVLGVVPGGNEIERALHKHFAKERILGEWFRGSERLRDLIWIYCEERYMRRCGMATAESLAAG